MTAGEQLALIERGAIGAVELLDLHLARVRQVNPTVNAVVALDEEGARTAAKAADAARAAGRRRGPLHGLPMTVKVTYEAVGMPATCGIVALKDHRPTQDADVVESLRAAGAVIFGKTNTPEGAGDHQTYNAVYGVTRNPWDLGRSAGGSSGGAAVAVATGMAPLDIGSDIGGSIRCPAHFNGVFGHKPSFGLVPMRGHIPPPPGTLTAPDLGVGGPLARSAADLARALDVIARPGALDRKGKVWRLPPARRERLADFRVALWADDRDYPVEPAYLDAIARFAADLRRAGVTVTEARPAIDPAESHAIYTAMLFGAWGTGLTDEAFAAYVEESRGLDPADESWAARVGRAPAQSLRDWLILLERREKMRWAWEAFFQDYDILLCPVMTTVAFPHDHSGVDHTAQLKRTIKVGSGTRPYLDNLIWPGLITVANLPSTAVPMPHRVGGLPAGIQAVSAFLEDRTTLAFAAAAEAAFGGYLAPDLAQLHAP
jgi:amidase